MEHYLYSTHKNSQWIKDLNLREKTIKHLEENMRENFLQIDIGNNFFLDTTQKQKEQNEKQTSEAI